MNTKRLLVLTIFGFFALLGVIIGVRPTEAMDKPIAKVMLEPMTSNIKANETYTLVITEDSYDQPVNAVQINLAYPQDALTFQAIDTSKSAFDIEAQNDNLPGKVKIARAVITPVTGKKEVARVTFKAKGDISSNLVTLAKDSAVVRSTDTTNLLDTSNLSDQQTTPAPESGKSSLWQTITSFFKKLFSFGKH